MELLNINIHSILWLMINYRSNLFQHYNWNHNHQNYHNCHHHIVHIPQLTDHFHKKIYINYCIIPNHISTVHMCLKRIWYIGDGTRIYSWNIHLLRFCSYHHILLFQLLNHPHKFHSIIHLDLIHSQLCNPNTFFTHKYYIHTSIIFYIYNIHHMVTNFHHHILRLIPQFHLHI